MKNNKHILIVSGIGILTILLFLSGTFTEIFQFDRAAIDQFQLWRLFTGHFTHWNHSHLSWDLLAFIIAAIAIHRIGQGKALFPLILTSALFVSIWVLLLDTHISLYRGLSGIDTALFVFLCIEMITQSIKEHNRKGLICFSFLAFIIIGKTFYELITGNVVFSESGNFIPLISAHLAGIVVAILFFMASLRQAQDKQKTLS